MPTLQTIQKIYNEFVCSALESEYATPEMTKPDLEQIKNELIEVIEEYTKEITEEQKEIKEND